MTRGEYTSYGEGDFISLVGTRSMHGTIDSSSSLLYAFLGLGLLSRTAFFSEGRLNHYEPLFELADFDVHESSSSLNYEIFSSSCCPLSPFPLAS